MAIILTIGKVLMAVVGVMDAGVHVIEIVPEVIGYGQKAVEIGSGLIDKI